MVMTVLTPPKPLTFPVPFPDVPAYLIFIKVAREQAHRTLGPPMLIDWVDAHTWDTFDSTTGSKIAADVKQHFIGFDVIVDPGTLDCLRVGIEKARGKRADDVTAHFKRLMDHPASARDSAWTAPGHNHGEQRCASDGGVGRDVGANKAAGSRESIFFLVKN